jgi:hypothetical protein
VSVRGTPEKRTARVMSGVRGWGRTMRERWGIPDPLREPLIERLGEIVRDRNSSHREVISATCAILMASKINLANIALTIQVQTHEELEERMTRIERRLDERDAKRGGYH